VTTITVLVVFYRNAAGHPWGCRFGVAAVAGVAGWPMGCLDFGAWGAICFVFGDAIRVGG